MREFRKSDRLRRRVQREFLRSDGDWFLKNPHRKYRLRPLQPSEPFHVGAGFVAPPGWEIWIIVQRLAAGVRAKHSVCVDPRIAADAATCEFLVEAMFELLVVNPAGGLVSTHEVGELAMQYDHAKSLN